MLDLCLHRWRWVCCFGFTIKRALASHSRAAIRRLLDLGITKIIAGAAACCRPLAGATLLARPQIPAAAGTPILLARCPATLRMLP